jgi:thymidylate synthase ThyX
MAYLEQSTRYISYDARIGGRYRFYRPPEVLQSTLGTRYVGDMDRIFDTYAELLPIVVDDIKERIPKNPSDSDFVYRQAIRAKAFDSIRGLLPASSLSNVGIYGTGQGYEMLLRRMRSSTKVIELDKFSELQAAIIKNGEPTLFVLDLLLPGVKGTSAVTEVKKMYPEVPLAVLLDACW